PKLAQPYAQVYLGVRGWRAKPVWELVDYSHAERIRHTEDFFMHFVVVGHRGSKVPFELVYGLLEGEVKVHLHVRLYLAQWDVLGVSFVEEGGDVVGIRVPLVARRL